MFRAQSAIGRDLGMMVHGQESDLNFFVASRQTLTTTSNLWSLSATSARIPCGQHELSQRVDRIKATHFSHAEVRGSCKPSIGPVKSCS
jgi:hypothetical protein